LNYARTGPRRTVGPGRLPQYLQERSSVCNRGKALRRGRARSFSPQLRTRRRDDTGINRNRICAD